jgi:predicted NBD/HSP70 family sugar kinase
LIGTAGIERLAREKYQLSLTAGQIIQAAADGKNPRAVAVMGEIGLLAGELLASLFPIFVPERIVLAGGTARAGEVLLRAARERFEHLAGGYCRTYARISKYAFSPEDIVLGDLLCETGVVGAVVDIFRDMERDTTL